MNEVDRKVAGPTWADRLRLGRPRKYPTAESFAEAVKSYFEWNDNHPMYEAKLVTYEDTSRLETIPRLRAMTVEALFIHMGLTKTTFADYRANPMYSEVAEQAVELIRIQKFEGAAANFFNGNIISRDIGLADRSEITGADGGPIKTENVHQDADDFTRRMAGLAARSDEDGDGPPDPGGEG